MDLKNRTRKYNGKKLCEAIIGRNELHLIKCKNKAEVIYFKENKKNWIGHLLCQFCFNKITINDARRGYEIS